MNKIEEYNKRKLEHLKKSKHERYFLLPTGDGFILIDKLANMEGYNERGYSLRCGPYGEPITDKHYKSADEFLDLINNLDFKVNGGLENKDMVLFSKPKLYSLIESKLDHILETDLIFPEKFNVAIQTQNNPGDLGIINVDVEVYKKSGLGGMLDDPKFMRYMEVTNTRLTELEKESDSQEKHIRIDELLNIKKLLLQKGEGGIL